MNVAAFEQLPLMGILRGIEKKQLQPLVDAILGSGLNTIEITMNTPHASDLIRGMRSIAGDRLTIGAGTVLNTDSLNQALDAGASFIVMPTLIDEVASYCSEQSIPFFPGALTPQEIFIAWQTEPTMVKVFPAKFFGPDYFKEIKGPFQQVKLLACGGVTPENLAAYAAAGATAFALGGSVFKQEWLQAGDFTRITALIQNYIQAYTAVKNLPHT